MVKTPSGPAGERLALKTTPRCVADAPSAWRGYGSGLRPLAVALSRLTRVPAVRGRCTVCVARVRQWVAPTGRRAFPADAGAGSVWQICTSVRFRLSRFKDDMFAAALHGRNGPTPFGAEH